LSLKVRDPEDVAAPCLGLGGDRLTTTLLSTIQSSGWKGPFVREREEALDRQPGPGVAALRRERERSGSKLN
jgi:hypothetical protein